MRHRVSGKRFDRSGGHRKMMFRTLVTDLLKHGHVKTTAAKARAARPIAEKMVTLGKTGSLHARRQAAAYITEDSVVRTVFDDIADRYRDRGIPRPREPALLLRGCAQVLHVVTPGAA